MFRNPLIAFMLATCLLAGLVGPAAGAADEPADASHVAEGGSHAAAEPNILEFKPSLAVATFIVFVVLLLVLTRFAWGPLAKALDAREAHNEELLRRAEDARAESERLLAEHKRQMEHVAEEVQAIIAEARRDASHTANEIVVKAQAEAEASRTRAERDIGTAKDQALAEIWNTTSNLAVNVAGKVLGRELGEDDHRRLIQAAMDELPRSKAVNGHGGRA